MADCGAECRSCHLTVYKLQKSIASRETELKAKDKLILEFSTVAMAQAKHLATLCLSGCAIGNMTCPSHCSSPQTDNNSTLSWFGAINAVPAPEDPWLLMGAKPKVAAASTPSHGPVMVRSPVGQVNVMAPMSSTTWQPEHWTVACKGKHGAKRPSPPPPARDLSLANKFDILDMQEFRPLGGPNHLPPSAFTQPQLPTGPIVAVSTRPQLPAGPTPAAFTGPRLPTGPTPAVFTRPQLPAGPMSAAFTGCLLWEAAHQFLTASLYTGPAKGSRSGSSISCTASHHRWLHH